MENTDKWLNKLANNKVRADNSVDKDGVIMVCNFREVPDTNTMIFMITMVKNHTKTNTALPPQVFRNMMNIVDNSIGSEAYNCPESIKESGHFESCNTIPKANDWQKKLNCHRFFFIPYLHVLYMENALFSENHKKLLKSYGISGIQIKSSYSFCISL